MTVTSGNTSSTTGVNVNTKTWSHTVPDHPNRILIVAISIRAYATILSITYGDQSLRRFRQSSFSTGNKPRTEMWYVFDPEVGTHSVTLNVSQADYFMAGAMDFYNVFHQLGDHHPGAGSTSPANTPLHSVASGDMAVAVACTEGASLAAAGVWTSLYGGVFSGSWRGNGAIATGTGTLAMNFTTAPSDWSTCGMVLRAIPSYTPDTYFITPVTDRTLADVVAKNEKAYFNVSDWNRIYSNTVYVNSLVANILGAPVTFEELQPLDAFSFVSATYLNKLILNIENIRVAINLPTRYGLSPLFHSWVAGKTKAPTYADVNKWERTLQVIYRYFENRNPRAGVAVAGAGLNRNSKWRNNG